MLAECPCRDCTNEKLAVTLNAHHMVTGKRATMNFAIKDIKPLIMLIFHIQVSHQEGDSYEEVFSSYYWL